MVACAEHWFEQLAELFALQCARGQPSRVEFGELGPELLEQVGVGALAHGPDVVHDARRLAHGAGQLVRAEQPEREAGEEDEFKSASPYASSYPR